MFIRRRRLSVTVALHLFVVSAVLAWASYYARSTVAPVSRAGPAGERVLFLAGGDIMISRGVARAIERSGDPLTPFKPMEAIFRSTDFNFANLESPISPTNNAVGAGLVFHTKRRDIAGLREYNFKVLNFANNHALDQGLEGLRNTHSILTENELQHVGTGTDLDEAWRPRIVEVRGIKIGFIGASYSSVNDGGATTNQHVARIEDTDRLAAAVNELRSAGVEIIVATMHAGVEYTRNPDAEQVAFARKAIDLGADIVIGSHPHWVQTVERYGGKYIFYSLGNLIFDQEWSRDTKEGLVLRIAVNKPGGRPAFIERIEMIPVVLENYSTPRPASEMESAAILQKIGETSRFIDPANASATAMR